MQTQTASESATLYYRQGGSDKVYHVTIEPAGGGGGTFVVNFAFGRRGSTLQTGTKTPRPVGYEQAKRVFEQLLREKTAKGYSPGEDGTPYARTAGEAEVSGVLPQLLNAIDEIDAEALLADEQWWMQEKLDGRRVLLRKRGDEVRGINRRGLLIALPHPIVAATEAIAAGSCLLDGEVVGDVYHAFDLLERDGTDVRERPYALRYDGALDLVDAVPREELRFVETASTPRAKRALLLRFRQEKKEGVVFKQRGATYTPGRPASGGPQLKLKFYATVSCLVAAVNDGKRSVRLELLDGVGSVSVGSVAIPLSHPVPRPGDVVEVRYLYAYPGGSLYQPTYLCRRDDLDAAACLASQLKLKSGGGNDGDDNDD
jgi:bifunctional non-homologous end joining protein LigD